MVHKLLLNESHFGRDASHQQSCCALARMCGQHCYGQAPQRWHAAHGMSNTSLTELLQGTHTECRQDKICIQTRASVYACGAHRAWPAGWRCSC